MFVEGTNRAPEFTPHSTETTSSKGAGDFPIPKSEGHSVVLCQAWCGAGTNSHSRDLGRKGFNMGTRCLQNPRICALSGWVPRTPRN